MGFSLHADAQNGKKNVTWREIQSRGEEEEERECVFMCM